MVRFILISLLFIGCTESDCIECFEKHTSNAGTDLTIDQYKEFPENSAIIISAGCLDQAERQRHLSRYANPSKPWLVVDPVTDDIILIVGSCR